jgi:hypothetical protein
MHWKQIEELKEIIDHYLNRIYYGEVYDNSWIGPLKLTKLQRIESAETAIYYIQQLIEELKQ